MLEPEVTEAAEADLAEQEAESAPVDRVEVGTEVPEADAIEQALPVGAGAPVRLPDELGLEVPEADALEQAYSVDVDDDYDRG